MRNILIIIVAIFGFSLPTFAQGTIDKDGVYRPTEEEITNNKRIIELWRHPTFVTLRLASTRREIPDEEPTTTPHLTQTINGCTFSYSLLRAQVKT